MLMNLRDLCVKYRFVPKGVIHVGAHKAEENTIYERLGIQNVVWIEGNPDLFNHLKQNFNKKGNQIFNYLVSDIDDKEYSFNITNNGESSSIFELGTHQEKHPHIFVTEKRVLKSKTLKTIISENDIDMNEFDFLNLDIQGAELLALKGLGEQISNIKFIYTEVNVDHLYKDCALVGEIDDYLKQFGFERVETNILNQYGWGDAFYIKSH
ncbi:MAG: methyltransferase [Bacteroidia bacterium]|nr:MAG: methyltransferase [Bacteroidia bacterium]